MSNGALRSLVPLIAATLALTAALTARCFVKAFAIAFLGQPRPLLRRGSPDHADAAEHAEAGIAERIGMAWLTLWCVALGLFPNVVLRGLDTVCLTLTGAGLPDGALAAGVLWLVPSTPAQASYGPLVFLAVITAVVVLTYFTVRWCFHGRIRRAAPWDCGFPEQTARMQDSSDGYGQSIRQIFAPIFRVRRVVPAPDQREPRFELHVEDRHWQALYLPLARLVDSLSAKIGALQQGRISVYLLYSFITLIALLVFVR